MPRPLVPHALLTPALWAGRGLRAGPGLCRGVQDPHAAPPWGERGAWGFQAGPEFQCPGSSECTPEAAHPRQPGHHSRPCCPAPRLHQPTGFSSRTAVPGSHGLPACRGSAGSPARPGLSPALHRGVVVQGQKGPAGGAGQGGLRGRWGRLVHQPGSRPGQRRWGLELELRTWLQEPGSRAGPPVLRPASRDKWPCGHRPAAGA